MDVSAAQFIIFELFMFLENKQFMFIIASLFGFYNCRTHDRNNFACEAADVLDTVLNHLQPVSVAVCC